MLERGVFVAAAGGGGERVVQRLFQLAGERWHVVDYSFGPIEWTGAASLMSGAAVRSSSVAARRSLMSLDPGTFALIA